MGKRILINMAAEKMNVIRILIPIHPIIITVTAMKRTQRKIVLVEEIIDEAIDIICAFIE